MTSWPGFFRELRVQARRPFNYWLRLAVAVTISLILGLNLGTATRGSTNPAEIGSWAFALVHSCVFFFIWIFVPTLTADCLAREKREDTLGLMFLTPLSARAIVLGKSLVHFIRASTCVRLVVPFLAVAILFGGVTCLTLRSTTKSNPSRSSSASLNPFCWCRDVTAFGASIFRWWESNR